MKTLKNLSLRQAMVLVLLVSLPGTLLAEFYKWRDKDGNIRYSDTLPPEDVNKKRAVMDKKGVRVKHVDRAKTDKEFAAEQARMKAEKERLKKLAAQQKRDRELLKFYRNEDEIKSARDAKVKIIKQSIEIDLDGRNILLVRLKRFQKSAAEYARAGKRAPIKIRREIRKIRQLVKRSDGIIKRKRAQQKKISDNYASLLDRYRHISKTARK